MARPQTISRRRILETARQLFLERGTHVSTADIARQAGISEGSIFKRFPTKHALFAAAMGLDEMPPWLEQLAQRAGQGAVQDNLRWLSLELIEHVRTLLPRIMLTWSMRSASQQHLQNLRDHDAPPRRVMRTIARYLAAEMAQGRLRQVDPELAARVFMGSIWNLVFMETTGQVQQAEHPEAFATRLVDTLWRGLAPSDGEEEPS